MLRTRLILIFILSEGRAGEACNTSDKSNALSNIGEYEKENENEKENAFTFGFTFL
jgi:hypothetical protein